ncbi:MULTISPECIES: hypothetical protein [Petrotoga]|nr:MULTISPECIES: hypothetical protein [Petrotoga]
MKKFLFSFSLVIFIFSITIFPQDILKLVPSDSKLVVLINDLEGTYADLKTVPTMKTLLLEPFNAELMISNFAKMYFNALKIDYESFLNNLNVNLSIFVQEPKENNYIFGFSIGPLENPQTFASDLDKLLELLKDYGISFTPVFQTIENENYLVMVQNKEVYSSSEKGVTDFEEILPAKKGLYYRINTSDYRGDGYFYTKDGFLIGGGNGTAETEFIDKNFVKGAQEYPFLGSIFFTSGLIPKDLTNYADFINIIVDYKIVENLISVSQGIEANVDLATSNGAMPTISNASYLKLKTDAKIDEIIPILNENNIKYKKTDENMMEFYIESEITNQNNETEMLTNTFYVWKDEYMMVSQIKPDELQKLLNDKPKLSENELFQKLSERIGTGDVTYALVDLTPIFQNYVPNLKGRYGLLLNVSPIEENKLKIDFIVQ